MGVSTNNLIAAGLMIASLPCVASGQESPLNFAPLPRVFARPPLIVPSGGISFVSADLLRSWALPKYEEFLIRLKPVSEEKDLRIMQSLAELVYAGTGVSQEQLIGPQKDLRLLVADRQNRPSMEGSSVKWLGGNDFLVDTEQFSNFQKLFKTFIDRIPEDRIINAAQQYRLEFKSVQQLKDRLLDFLCAVKFGQEWMEEVASSYLTQSAGLETPFPFLQPKAMSLAFADCACGAAVFADARMKTLVFLTSSLNPKEDPLAAFVHAQHDLYLSFCNIGFLRAYVLHATQLREDRALPDAAVPSLQAQMLLLSMLPDSQTFAELQGAKFLPLELLRSYLGNLRHLEILTVQDPKTIIDQMMGSCLEFQKKPAGGNKP